MTLALHIAEVVLIVTPFAWLMGAGWATVVDPAKRIPGPDSP